MVNDFPMGEPAYDIMGHRNEGKVGTGQHSLPNPVFVQFDNIFFFSWVSLYFFYSFTKKNNRLF
jgi:hypothetical protein